MVEEAPAIGIDLGSTNSCVAVFQNGQVEIIANNQGMRTTPSCVAFTDSGRLIGESAQLYLLSVNPSQTVYDAKRLIGRRFDDPSVQSDLKRWPFQVINHQGKPKIQVQYKGENKTFFPEEISAMILLKMKETAEAYLGKPVTKAVITVPAYFNDSQRRATKDAASIAGLKVLRLLNDTTATAMAYGFQNKDDKEKNLLIFDLGGGTFDVSVLVVKGSQYKVKSSAGDSSLGGEDFNSRMVEYFIKEIQRKHGKDISTNLKALIRLRFVCDRAKRLLSSSTEAPIMIVDLFEGIDFQSTITRARFDELNEDLFSSTLELVGKVVKDAGLDRLKITEVIPVGGSSCTLKIQQLLQYYFSQKELNKSVNPDESVATGAAILAAFLNGDKSEVLKDLVLCDVLSHSLGVSITEGGIMSTMLERNTTIPSIRVVSYITSTNSQKSINFRIYEGERVLVKENTFLGQLKLEGLRPALEGKKQLIDVTFKVEEDGVLTVTVAEKGTDVQNTATLMMDETPLPKEEISRLVEEAERYRLDDIRLRDLTKSKKALESYCRDVKSRLEKGKPIIVKKCNEAIKWLGTAQPEKKEEVDKKMEEIVRLFNGILHPEEGSADGSRHTKKVGDSGDASSSSSSNKRRRTTE